MDKEFKTTFIPKKNLATSKKPRTKKSRAQQSLLGVIAMLLFITAILAAGGVFVVRAQMVSQLNSRIESINRAEKAFEPAVILELKRLDLRLAAGTELLDNHIAVSDFLKSLAESTLPDVSFADLSFSYADGTADVNMSGEARGYQQIAQQSDVFGDNQFIQNHIFSDFALTDTGRISFSLQFTLNQELLKFGRTVANDQVENIDQELSEAVIIEDQNPIGGGRSNVNFEGF